MNKFFRWNLRDPTITLKSNRSHLQHLELQLCTCALNTTNTWTVILFKLLTQNQIIKTISHIVESCGDIQLLRYHKKTKLCPLPPARSCSILFTLLPSIKWWKLYINTPTSHRYRFYDFLDILSKTGILIQITKNLVLQLVYGLVT